MPQQSIIDFLSQPASYGLSPGALVERIETHAATVFLAGDHAFKMKREVCLPYLDFSTLEKRKSACENELRLNRRTAPRLYLGLVPLTRDDGGALAIGGDGRVCEWLVKMRRFPPEALLDQAAREHPLPRQLLLRLADHIAAFHGAAESAVDWGGADELARIAQGNAERIARYTPALFDAARATAVNDAVQRAIESQRPLLERRRAEGKARHCHGDLHLGNIFLDGEEPTLFDAIEFDDRLARNDVLYDLAFLLMDLWHRRSRREANLVLNRYLLRTGDYAGLAAMPLFLALRAEIRAHVSATMAENAADPAPLIAEARDYLRMAGDFLAGGRVALLAVGGFSGSGKSHLASALAPLVGPAPGAICLRSDEIRKTLLGRDPEETLDATAYTGAVSARVYAELRARAVEVLAAGHAVIADAVHNRPETRRALEDLAAAAGVPFLGLWLEADAALMARRIAGRRHDASDADVEVMHRQVAAGAGRMTWHKLAAVRPLAENLEEIQRLLDDRTAPLAALAEG
ncbi:MAG: AAA family ATPase [Alphaproteobacteria bacterium]|nr:AAA family ATPase [Alphaproteobacteria bacterium]MDP6814733.1 AAA family ATPase [Alphaproteobacteria bacterium]